MTQGQGSVPCPYCGGLVPVKTGGGRAHGEQARPRLRRHLRADDRRGRAFAGHCPGSDLLVDQPAQLTLDDGAGPCWAATRWWAR